MIKLLSIGTITLALFASDISEPKIIIDDTKQVSQYRQNLLNELEHERTFELPKKEDNIQQFKELYRKQNYPSFIVLFNEKLIDEESILTLKSVSTLTLENAFEEKKSKTEETTAYISLKSITNTLSKQELWDIESKTINKLTSLDIKIVDKQLIESMVKKVNIKEGNDIKLEEALELKELSKKVSYVIEVLIDKYKNIKFKVFNLKNQEIIANIVINNHSNKASILSKNSRFEYKLEEGLEQIITSLINYWKD